MTNKEAIEYIKTDISRLWDTPQNLEHKEALEMAIRALGQKPCKDAISRQAVLEQIDYWAIGNREYMPTNAMNYLMKRMQDLPPVTPQPKIGHWIFCENLTTYWKEVYKCSECNEDK